MRSYLRVRVGWGFGSGAPARFPQRVGKKGIGRQRRIFLYLAHPLFLSLPTLNLVFWGGQTRIVAPPKLINVERELLNIITVFAQYPGWAAFIETISKDGNSGWAMPTKIISRVDRCPPCPPSAGAHGLV